MALHLRERQGGPRARLLRLRLRDRPAIATQQRQRQPEPERRQNSRLRPGRVSGFDAADDRERAEDAAALKPDGESRRLERRLRGGHLQRRRGERQRRIRGDVRRRWRSQRVGWHDRDAIGGEPHHHLEVEHRGEVRQRVGRGNVGCLSRIHVRQLDVEITRIAGVSPRDRHAPETVRVLRVAARQLRLFARRHRARIRRVRVQRGRGALEREAIL